jgi:hypothetical protein
MRWELWRQDEHGSEFLVRAFDDRLSAERARDEFVARGHHQHYWVSRERVHVLISPRRDGDHYRRLADDIAALGYDVELEDASGPDAPRADVELYLSEVVAGAAVRQLLDTVKDRLYDDSSPTCRTAVVYGPDRHEVLAELRVPERDD